MSVEIKNDSDICGEEIVQLYINDLVSEVIRPNRELKDFKRLKIKAKEKVTVKFTVTEEKLAYYHEDGELYADAGEFEVFIGGDSETKNSVKIKLNK